MALVDPCKQVDHFSRGCTADAIGAAIGTFVPGFAVGFGAAAAAADLAQRQSFIHAKGGKPFIDGIEPDPVDDEVGGRVVTDRHHETGRLLECDLVAIFNEGIAIGILGILKSYEVFYLRLKTRPGRNAPRQPFFLIKGAAATHPPGAGCFGSLRQNRPEEIV